MKVAILISGNGSNLQSIIDNSADIGIDISCVISNKVNAFGLQRAKNAKIKTEIIISKNKDKEIFESELSNILDKHQVKVIILAGFMRILTTNFVKKYEGKILNIHPSLLPKFKGLNTHSRAIEAGETTHGATVHIVSNELDSGKIIMQTSVDITANDTVEILAKKVLAKEHILYPQAIKKFIKNV